MRKLITSPLGLCLLAMGLSSNSLGESLKETYEQALANDHTFQGAKATYEAGKQNKAINRAGLLPQLQGQASWSDSTTDVTSKEFLDTSKQPPEIVGESSNSIDTTSTGYSITLTQQLFNLNQWHTFKRGVALADAAEAQFHSAEQSLIVRTAEEYFAVLQAADTLETSRAEENALSHQLEQTKQRFEVGLTAITEVHEAQAAYDSAVAARLTAEGQLGIAFEGLEVITGNSYSQLSPLKEKFPVTNPEPMDREEWVKFALENNFSLKASSMNAKAAKQFAKAARASHLPTLSGSLSYSDSSDEETFKADSDSETQAISLTLSVPLFAGGRTHASRRQANYQSIEAREQFNQLQRDTIQQTRSFHLQVVTGVATVKARAQAITSSQSALDATQAGYEVGTRDLVDVLNAQRTLYGAQRDYLNSLYDYILSTLRLKESAGILSPNEIDQLDDWLDKNKSVRRL